MFAQRTLMKVVGAAIALCLTALATVGTASAEPADESFLKKLDAAGILYQSPESVIDAAHHACADLDAGVAPQSIIDDMKNRYQLATWEAKGFLVASVESYCPKYRSGLGIPNSASADRTFVAKLTAAGIKYESKDAVIGAAHDVCIALRFDALSLEQIAQDMGERLGLQPSQAGAFVAAAVESYCPEYLPA